MKKVLFLSLVLSALLGSACPATTRRVPSEYPSIQQAIIDCNDGDTVIVSPGVYYETINFSGKNIVVTSKDPNDPKIVGYTIINADDDGTVVTFENGETSKAVLAGFTITGGVGTMAEWSSENYKYFYGAGIYCRWGTPTITRNVIRNNHGPYVDELRGNTWYEELTYGGAICCESGDVTITHNIIYNNSAYMGAAIYTYRGTIADNIIYHNSAAYGGGVYIGAGYLVNNTIVANDCSKQPDYGYGGNVYASFSYNNDLIIANNIICGAESGGGLFYYPKPRVDLIRYNNVWNNVPANYGMQDPRTNELVFGDQADWTGQFGNISEDPIFVDVWNNNYRISPGSPCISGGDPTFIPASGTRDIDGDPRVYAKCVDVGADEYTGYVKPLADAGADQHVLAPQPIALTGADSYFSDPNGAKTYRWAQKDGPTVELSDATAVQPAFTPPALGSYRFQLLVGDGQYTSKPDEVLVVVGNERPVADAGPDRLWPIPGWVGLDGSASLDADPPDQLTYTWTQIDGPGVSLLDPNSASPYFQCNTPGIYAFQLVVSDGFVSSEPDIVKLQTSSFTLDSKILMETDYPQGYFFYPDASGTKLVYATGDYDDSTWVINCKDTRTGKIDKFEGGGVDTMPRIDGNLIVWWGGQGTYYQPACTSVFLGDLTTGQTQYVRMTTGTDSYGYPAISGNKLVWLQFRSVDTRDATGYDQTPYDICGADVTNPGKPVYFTIAEQVGRCPPYPYSSFESSHTDMVDISGNIVVWESSGDIYGADLSDLSHIKTFPICTAPQRQYDPAVSGHLVVWTDERDDIGDIYGADISNPNAVREFKVVAEPGYQLQPDIDGSLVAFADGDPTVGNIRACCITRDYGVVPFMLPMPQNYISPFYGAAPRIDGATICWQQWERIQCISLQFGYDVATGPARNLTTGAHYDYIQHAIEAAAAGDTIEVQPGTYPEKLLFRGKALTVTSTNPQDRQVRAATVIEGMGQIVTFADGEGSNSVLAGLTISGGSFGIYCGASSPTISDCVIANNSCAGIKLWDQTNPTITSSEITGNGTGVEMWELRGSRFTRIQKAALQNCLIAGNRRDGIWGGRPTLGSCTIANNFGYGINSVLVNANSSIIYFNHVGGQNLKIESAASVLTYCDTQGGRAGEGNIDVDPLFVASGRWANPVQRTVAPDPGDPAVKWIPGDYHLKSEGWTWDVVSQAWIWYGVTSPCIDAGDPSLPFDEEPKCEQGSPLWDRAGANARIDVGVYGGTPEASLAPRPSF